jgi:hypothetical protein
MKTLWQEDVRRELTARLEKLSPAAPAEWGKMNASQMLAHLNNSFLMATGELPVKSKKLPIRFTPLKQLIIYVLPFPKGAPTARELISRDPGNWDIERENLRNRINGFTTADRIDLAAEHPAFGRMTPKTWGVLGYRHIDHHFRQFGA